MKYLTKELQNLVYEIFPGGLPTVEEIEEMDQEKRRNTIEKQNLILKSFSNSVQAQIKLLENKFKELGKKMETMEFDEVNGELYTPPPSHKFPIFRISIAMLVGAYLIGGCKSFLRYYIR